MPSLDGPEDTRERGGDRAGGAVLQRDWRRTRGIVGPRRLHVGQQVLVRGESIEQLDVHLRLDLRELGPAPVVRSMVLMSQTTCSER